MRTKISGGWQFVRRVFTLAAPYWKSEESRSAWALLVMIVVLTLGLVYLNVQLNTWNRDFYNMLDNRDLAQFGPLLLYFTVLAVIFITAAVVRFYLTQALQIRWRVWLTKRYINAWLQDRVFYRLELDRHGTDNPDQRIAEDVRDFTSDTLS